MRKLQLTLLTISFLLISINFSVFAQNGTELQFKVEKANKPTENFNIKASSGNMTIGTPSVNKEKERADMIYKGASKEVIAIQHESQSYMVINEAMITQMKTMMGGFQQEMQDIYKNLPPEALEKMKEAQKSGAVNLGMGMAPKEIKAVNSGQKATKQGYPCVRYDIMENGQKKREIWITPWSAVKGGAEVKKAMIGFMTFMQELSNEMSQGMPGGGSNLFDDIDYEEGMPVVIIDLKTGETTSLESAKEVTMPGSTFGPPAGYKEERSF